MAPGTGFAEDNFFTDGVGEDGSGSVASYGEQWGAADETLLARLPLTSCCAAQFLTEPIWVCGQGLGTPGLKDGDIKY